MPAIPLRKLEGKYEILDKLREGGMGAIYKVRHRLLDEIRVIKTMRQQLVEDVELRARFVREARMAIQLRHPNIAQLYDFTVDEDDGTAFIVMEYIDGKTLEDIVKASGPPPLGLTLEIAQQSLKALGYLHSKGLIHRDISPDNLMLTGDTEGEPLVKLIDLGIAKSLVGGEGDRHTATGMYLGKVRYSSPEQFGAEGAAPLDARGDLYSFGIVLYELLTGKYPIAGRDSSSLIAGHLFRPPKDFAETDPGGRVPEGLRALVQKTLAKDPVERPQSAAELSRGLAAFRAPGDVEANHLKRALERHSGSTGRHPTATRSATTQGKLDDNFALAPTPPPRPVPVPAPAVPAIPAVPAVDPRAAEIAAALHDIEAALARGDYRAAEAMLYGAEASYGAQTAFPALYERVERLRRQDQESKVVAHLASARQHLEAGDFAAARAEARRAHGLDAAHPGLAAVDAEITAAERAAEERRLEAIRQAEEERLRALQEAEEQRRQAQRAEAVAAIDGLLDTGDLARAGELLQAALASHGAATAFERLATRLAALQAERRDREARQAEAAKLAASARSLAVQRDFPAALELLQKALALTPEDPELAEQRADTEAAAEHWRQEKLQAEALAREQAEAEKRRQEAEKKRLEEERLRLEAIETERRRAEEARQAEAARQEARREAEKLAREKAQAEERRRQEAEEARQRAANEKKQRERVDKLAGEAAIFTRIGDTASAIKKLRQALEIAPGEPRLTALLAELEAPAKVEPPPPAAPPPASSIPTMVLPKAAANPPAAAKPAATVAPALDLLATRDLRFDVLPAAGHPPVSSAIPATPTPPASPATLPTRASVPPAGRRTLVLAGGGILLLVLLALFAWWASHRGPTPVAPTVSPAPPAEAPAATPQPTAPTVTLESPAAPPGPSGAAAGTGSLVLAATPWAKVTAIVDGGGRAQPLPAENERTTPLVLALRPGRYKVTLVNPNFPQPVTVEAEVVSGAVVRGIAQFGSGDPDAFLKGLGW